MCHGWASRRGPIRSLHPGAETDARVLQSLERRQEVCYRAAALVQPALRPLGRSPAHCSRNRSRASRCAAPEPTSPTRMATVHPCQKAYCGMALPRTFSAASSPGRKPRCTLLLERLHFRVAPAYGRNRLFPARRDSSYSTRNPHRCQTVEASRGSSKASIVRDSTPSRRHAAVAR